MKTAVLHYTAPPVIGGVEAVIHAHAVQFVAAGLPLTVIAGRGEPAALPPGVDFIRIPEFDPLHPAIQSINKALDMEQVPQNFDAQASLLADQLRPLLGSFDRLIVHNIFTRHFNLALTAALFRLLDEDALPPVFAWTHDLTLSRRHTRNLILGTYPWNLVRRNHDRLSYVAISMQRQKELIETLFLPPARVQIIYNGVDPRTLLGLSEEGSALIERMDLWSSDLILLMPVRVSEAKNIEFALETVAALKTMQCRPKLVLTGPPDHLDKASMDYYETLLELRRRLDVEQDMLFVYEYGPQSGEGYTIPQRVFSDLYRVADALFLPSHREGFGIPVLEAGLAGLPVICTAVPAARELALDDAFIFPHHIDPVRLAEQILNWADDSPEHRLKVRVRQGYTWKAIFKRDILPLLNL